MIKSKERIKEFGEVFTPAWLVSDMCDLVNNEIINEDTSILEPCCGNGNFLIEILRRRLSKPNKTTDYIRKSIQNLRGIDILPDNVQEAKSRLLSEIVEHLEGHKRGFIVEMLEIMESNIVCGDYLNDDLFTGISFDLIITNSPYQKMDGGFGASARPIYQHFINKAIAGNSRFIVMVVPARWYTGGKGLNDFRKQMINDTCIKELHDYCDFKECFDNIRLSGGVCYFLRDNEYAGKCNIVSHSQGKIVSEASRYLKYKNFNFFIRYNRGISILDKVLKNGFSPFSDIVYNRNAFNMRTNFKDFYAQPFLNSIKLYARKQVGYIDRNNIKKNPDLIDKWKVFITNAYGGGSSLYQQIINKPFVGKPGSVCTETFLYIGSFASQQEADNVVSYMKTKFFRFMIFLIKNTQDGSRKCFQLAPLQDFSKQWTDDMLYKKYGLNADEIAFIEARIKPME